MKAGINRETFQTEVIKAIYSIGDRNIVEEITDELVNERGFERGMASDIMQGNAQYDILSVVELGAVLDDIYKITKMPSARLELYLELAEINQVDVFKFQKVSKKDKDQLLVFEDARQVDRDIWTVVVPVKRIVDLYRANKITYNPETQRDPKTIRDGDKFISIININNDSVEAIRDELINRTFIPNTITFNVPMMKGFSINHDQKRNRLVVEGGMDILDGYHRSAGALAASRHLDGNLDYNFELRITNFNTEKARRYIVQEDKRNTISKEYIKSIDTTDYISNIVNNINESGRSELRGKISTSQRAVKSGHATVTFDLMYSMIESLWSIKSVVDAEDLSKYLINFFNRLMHSYTTDRSRSSLKDSDIAFYLTLAKKIEKDEHWANTLQDILRKINIEEGVNEEIRNYNMSDIKRYTMRFIELSNRIIKEAS